MASDSRHIRMPFVPALDGLRGLAVAGVVAFHLGYLRGGFLGVDLFFVLSGYLITSLLVLEWVHKGTIDLKVFWVRRARRLLPALFLVIGAVAAYAALAARNIDLARIRADGLATLLYAANWHELATGVDYFDTVRTPSPLQHTWSLAIEEQFYVLWPLLVIAVVGRRFVADPSGGRLTRLFAVTAGLAVASATAMVVLHGAGDPPERVYYGTDTRVAAILIGAALALAFARWGRPTGRRATALLDMAGLVAAGGLVMAWARASGSASWLFEGGFALCGLAAVVLIAAATGDEHGAIATACAWAPIRFLGRLSYGIYLWHWPVIIFLDPARTGIDGAALAVVRAAVSLALAMVSYRLVEQPIRLGAWKGAPIRFATVGAVTACTIALLAATVSKPTDLDAELAIASEHPDRLQVADDTPRFSARPDDTRPAGTSTTNTTMPGATTTTTEPAPLSGTVLVVGDSGAYALGGGMARVQSEFGLAVVNRGTIACGIARGDGRIRNPDGKIFHDPVGCSEYLTRWQSYLSEFRPHAVILVLAAAGGGERLVNGRWMGDCDPGHDRWLQDQTVTALRLLGSTGAQVAVTTIPYVTFFQAPSAATFNDCRNEVLRAAAESVPGTRIVDLRDWVCPTAASCRTHHNGVELRHDGIHFGGDGADVASRWIFGQLTRTESRSNPEPGVTRAHQ